MKNSIVLTIIVALLVGGAGFFAGMQYQKSQRSQAGQFNNQGRRSGSNGQNGNLRSVAGEILSADDKSIIVKLQDGSSKIVLVSDSTQINKAQLGSKSDLKIGERVAVFGSTNSDGSVTAQNIQLNPQYRGAMSSPSASPESASPK